MTDMQRPVNPERSRRSMAAALEAAQRSFESAGDRPFAASQVSPNQSVSQIRIFELKYLEAAVRDLTDSAMSGRPQMFAFQTSGGTPLVVTPTGAAEP